MPQKEVRPSCQKAVSIAQSKILMHKIKSAAEYSGNFEKARIVLKNNGTILDILSKSQFNRRLHRIKEEV